MTTEQLQSTRTIKATPEAIFAVLSDPAQHQFTEPTDWVNDALTAEPISGVEQIFSIAMFFEKAGGDYRIDNKVTHFEPNRTIGWQPGQIENETWGSGGWRWRYDLSPTSGSPESTDVTLTYDWTDVPEQVRQDFGGFPVVPKEFLDESLATLDRYVTKEQSS